MLSAIIVFFLTAACYLAGVYSGRKHVQREAISAAHGHYNKGTGKFKFGMDPATVTLKRVSVQRRIDDLQDVHDRILEAKEAHINELYCELEKKDKKIDKLKAKRD